MRELFLSLGSINGLRYTIAIAFGSSVLMQLFAHMKNQKFVQSHGYKILSQLRDYYTLILTALGIVLLVVELSFMPQLNIRFQVFGGVACLVFGMVYRGFFQYQMGTWWFMGRTYPEIDGRMS